MATDTLACPVATPAAPRDRLMAGKGRRIIPNQQVVVLEEDPPIRALLERWLREAGYEVAPPQGGTRPALVIADVPDPRSARTLVRSLREYAAPILLLSARFHPGLGGSSEAARRLGVKGVLPKPFTRRELLSAVRGALEDIS